MKADFHAVLTQTLRHAQSYLDNLDNAPVSATVELAELRRRLSRPLTEDGAEAMVVINELVADVAGGLLGSAGGRFFGWVVGGTLPSALAADWLTSTWDQSAALYACSPAEAVIEEVCGEWLKELLGLPAHASFAFVTGCQMAHTTCLAAARTALLHKHGWDVERQGIFGAPPIRILCGQRHGSIERAVRLLGFGSNHLVVLPVDGAGRLQTEGLAAALANHSGQPTIVLLQAGDINTGGFDNFQELIPLAHEYGAWVHIDGAFGLWANVSPTYKHLLDGAAKADSWATDGHKWLNVPYDSGYAFIADATSHRASMSHRASYLTHDAEARDQLDWNPEWSRRGRGVATYAALRELGRRGLADLIERTCRHAHELVARIGTLDGAEIISEAQLNQGLVRFPAQTSGATAADHDQRTSEIIARILAGGEAFFEGTTYQGKRWMRISVCNWQTDDRAVDRAVEAVRRALDEVSKK